MAKCEKCGGANPPQGRLGRRKVNPEWCVTCNRLAALKRSEENRKNSKRQRERADIATMTAKAVQDEKDRATRKTSAMAENTVRKENSNAPHTTVVCGENPPLALTLPKNSAATDHSSLKVRIALLRAECAIRDGRGDEAERFFALAEKIAGANS